ncbi:glycosyltransferase [Pseudokineococcus sp. 1T1Z-3]|uniref:glycosyltransferase n=1 Tax=Pseudokineococcus sp. 1T1Z-3 TaxID=3132745 RepID=UPI0030AAE181
MSPRRPTGVLHVVESWPPVVSGYTSRGWEVVGAQQCDGLVAPSVLVSSRQRVYDDRPLLHPAGLAPVGGVARVRQAPVSSSERRRRRLRQWAIDGRALRRATETAVAELGAQVVHGHFSSTIGAACAGAARAAGVPFVAEVRFDLAGAAVAQTLQRVPPRLTEGPERAARRLFERHLARADAVVSASSSLAGLLLRADPDLAGRLTTAPNGVDVRRFSPRPPSGPQAEEALGVRRRLGLADDAVVVGSTAKMLRYEGLDLLVQAVGRLAAGPPTSRPRVHLLLVGGGPEETPLRELAARTGAPVTFTGLVPPDAVAAHLRAMDVFAVPRRDVSVTRYAAPLKLLEALAAGLPVVASPVGDIPELLGAPAGDAEQGPAGGAREVPRGLLAPAGDVGRLVAALEAVAGDAGLRGRLGAAARGWALAAATWEATAAITTGVYERVLPAGSGGVGGTDGVVPGAAASPADRLS